MQTSSGSSKENSAATESGENQSESEIQHVFLRAVKDKDILLMAKELSSSTAKRLSIRFCGCDLKVKNLKYLCDNIKQPHGQITTFAISYGKDIDELLIEKICFIVREYGTTSLSFEYDKLNGQSLEIFKKYLQDEELSTTKPKIKRLDISYNEKITEDGFGTLGKIMSQFKIESLKAAECGITERKLKKFLCALGDFKLKEFNIGCNDKLTDNDGLKILAEFVAKKGADHLRLGGCRLSKEDLVVFYKNLPQTVQESLLKELDFSYNSTITPETSLGSVVVKCGATKLSMAGCKLGKRHLVHLRKSMKKQKMELVNLRDNATICNGIDEIARLVHECEVQELNICDCFFSAPELECFRTALKGQKVRILHLGDHDREPDKRYIDELCALLTNVEEVLYLRFHKLSKDFRELLENNCPDKTTINLTVGNKNEVICANKSSGADGHSHKEESSTPTKIEKPPPAAVGKEATEQQASNEAAEKEKLPASPESIGDQSSLEKEPSTSSELETSSLTTESKRDDALKVKLLLPGVHIDWSTTDETELSSSPEDALEDFLSQNVLPHKDKMNLLQQIEYFLMQLHRENISCNGLSHSQIFITKNNFSCSTSNRRYSESSRQADIRSLANLYCLILTNGKISEYSDVISEKNLECPCPNIAHDIIKKMMNSEMLTIQEVIQHPFHWDDLRKVLFICRAVDYISAKLSGTDEEEGENILKQFNMGDEPSVISSEGWFQKMKLNKDEIGGKLSVHYEKIHKSIYDISLRHAEKEKRKMSVYYLLRFFRKRYQCFHADPDDAKMCFGSYPEGFLKFFTSRFPELFMHVYNNMRPHLLTGAGAEEFASFSPNQSSFSAFMRI